VGWLLVALSALFLGLFVKHSLQYDFITLDGHKEKWSNSQGKWTVVNYFAEWCAPCLKEIPELNHFYQQTKQDTHIYAVSFDPLNSQQLIDLKSKYDIQFPILTTLNSMPWQQPPNSLPTTYILNADGQLMKQLKGEQSAEKLKQTIRALKAL
jgi:thiol-disulfide isomerase/thioredoxin